MTITDNSTIDPLRFRDTLGHFPAGITVISAVVDGAPVGMTCQSFFSLSLDPPLVAFSVAKTSKTMPLLRQAGSICVNILGVDQTEVSRSMSRSGTDKWAGITWTPGSHAGHPRIAGAIAWLECEFDAEHDGGDHTIVVARVHDLGVAEGQSREPLLYFRSSYSTLTAIA